jgi:hypothetical protein
MTKWGHAHRNTKAFGKVIELLAHVASELASHHKRSFRGLQSLEDQSQRLWVGPCGRLHRKPGKRSLRGQVQNITRKNERDRARAARHCLPQGTEG